MTKRTLLKWLDKQKQKAFNDAKAEHNKVYTERQDAIYRKMGLKEVADGIQKHMTEAAKVWDAWINKPDVKDYISSWYSSIYPDSIFNNYTGQEGHAYTKLTGDILRLDSAELEQLSKNQEIELRKINETYNNVITVVDGMATAKDAAAYLTGLGFDLSEVDKPAAPVTALAIQIDPHYLFINKAEKAA